MRWVAFLVTLLLPTLCCGQEIYVSHPGGDLDRWLHSSSVPTGVAGTYAESVLPVGTTTYYTAVSYPARSSMQWNVEGDWSPTKEKLVRHLLRHSNHSDVRGIYTESDLRSMTLPQLKTLHDDSHNHRIARTTRVVTYSSTVRYSAPAVSSCPGGVCPASTSSRRAERMQRHRGGSFSLLSITRN